ncbi:hypothetical protein [Paenibacillus brevis]|uniref:Uncharacterized protein n=1 Tax=Paenibacillus brevis TaxID=2841508 RepID=A0ABS6FU63_9BACL|nr:hypothetical protein [Paenibacillus brevis]MBU5673767.1 hypothetical protein [Paenibacillus brevis]
MPKGIKIAGVGATTVILTPKGIKFAGVGAREAIIMHIVTTVLRLAKTRLILVKVFVRLEVGRTSLAAHLIKKAAVDARNQGFKLEKTA